MPSSCCGRAGCYMTDSRNVTEAQRWLKQALHDRDAARLNRDALGDLDGVIACVQHAMSP